MVDQYSYCNFPSIKYNNKLKTYIFTYLYLNTLIYFEVLTTTQ